MRSHGLRRTRNVNTNCRPYSCVTVMCCWAFSFSSCQLIMKALLNEGNTHLLWTLENPTLNLLGARAKRSTRNNAWVESDAWVIKCLILIPWFSSIGKSKKSVTCSSLVTQEWNWFFVCGLSRYFNLEINERSIAEEKKHNLVHKKGKGQSWSVSLFGVL